MVARAKGWLPKLERSGHARAPHDIEVLEFAVKWRINPEEVRQNWSIRDLRWVQIVEQATALAAPTIARWLAERASKNRST